ncbi:MAG: TRAP transporter substrate-binding protein [Xanthobacter sp.]
MIKTTLLAAALALCGVASVAVPAKAQQTLRLGHYFATEDFRGRTAQHLADKVNEMNVGLNVHVYPNESLVKGREALQATSQGVVDLYSVYAGYLSGQVPLINIFSLPFPPDSYDDAAMYKLAQDPKTVALLDKTFERFGVKYLGAINSSGPAQLFLNREVKNVFGIKGMKLRGAGGLSDEGLSQLGASVVMLSAAEQFLALQTGTVDGIETTWSSYINYGLAKVAPVYVASTVVRSPYLLLMNKAKYDSLSDAQKTALQEAVTDTISWSKTHFDEEQNKLLAKVEQEAKTIVRVSPEENAELRKQMQPIYEGFVTRNGEIGQALMQRWKDVSGLD